MLYFEDVNLVQFNITVINCFQSSNWPPLVYIVCDAQLSKPITTLLWLFTRHRLLWILRFKPWNGNCWMIILYCKITFTSVAYNCTGRRNCKKIYLDMLHNVIGSIYKGQSINPLNFVVTF